MLVPALRAHVAVSVARWLETGRLDGAVSRAVASAHARFARHAVARPLHVPRRSEHGTSMLTITVGGATLGGSGRTRVALACVVELASRGAQVVLVGHGYGATPKASRVVTAADALGDVGDEALACARALAALPNARVVVGPSRRAAIDHVAALAPAVDAVVIDGPLQLAPERASLSILALDAEAPWGAGALPPAGDLRAPRDALLAHADHVVLVDATPRGAVVGGEPIALTELASRASRARARVGIFTALARPERLTRALERSGIVASTTLRAADHGPVSAALGRRLVEAPVDLWLATEKCATHLDAVELRAPLAILDGSLVLPEVLREALAWDMRPHAWLDPSIRKALLSASARNFR